MNKNVVPLILVVISICLAVSASAEPLKLSMLPSYSADDVNNRITPLAKYLSREVGQPIEPVLAGDYAQYEKMLKDGAIQIGYENPYIYTLVSETHDVIAITIKDTDGNKSRGVIITRKDSDINMVADLRNRKVMVVGRTSAGGYLSQKITLSEAGIDLEKECQVIEASDNKQENVVLSVYLGDAAAGFIRESALNKVEKYIPIDQIRIVQKSEFLPNWVFSVEKSLPQNIKKSILDALVKLDQKSPVLQSLKIDGFRESSDDEYDSIRRTAELPIPER